MTDVFQYAVIDSKTHEVLEVPENKPENITETQKLVKIAINKEVLKGQTVAVWNGFAYEESFALTIVFIAMSGNSNELNKNELNAFQSIHPSYKTEYKAPKATEDDEDTKSFVKAENFQKAYDIILQDICEKYKKPLKAK